jgi:hypothetical protein
VLVVDTVGFAPGLLNQCAAQRTTARRRTLLVRSRDAAASARVHGRDPLFLTEPVTGSNAMDISGVPYDAEPCEDLTIDEDAELGPRG